MLDILMKNAVVIAGGLSGMVVVALIIGTMYVGIPQPTATRQVGLPSTVSNTLKTVTGVDQRRKFAYNIEVNTVEIAPALTNARYTVEGEQATTLVITSEGISMGDCLDMQKSTNGQSAASIGFTNLTCRNPVSNGEWTLPLP